MLPYRYHPLQCSDSIRLLVLHPSPTQLDPVLCTVRHSRLSEASLKYEALSYTWGDATQKQAIYFASGSRELSVTKNCLSALLHLRYTHDDRMLWVDAICINQEDLKERASQVRMMDKIFERAFNVMVFLGDANPRNDILFKELAAADEVVSRVGHCNRPPPSKAVIQQLEELFQNPWFKRVWVLQEVCAKKSVTFMCGSARFSYLSLLNLYMGHRGTVVTKEFWPLTTQWIRRPPEEFSTPQFSLWNRLGESRDYLATDPRDRVFALKSLIGLEQSRMNRLIDYTRSVEECFTDVATFLLPVLGLRLLSATRHPHRRKMPSWIPDWSQTLPLQLLNFLIEFPKSGQPVSPARASQKQRYEIRPFLASDKESHLELRVIGCRYAQIVKSSQVFRFRNGEDARRQMKRLYSSLDNLRHFVGTESKCDGPAMDLPLDEDILHAMNSMSDLELDMHLRRGSMTGIHLGFLSNVEIMRDLFTSLQDCKISLMCDDDLVIVPEVVHPGDMICILSGAISPCALRASPDGTWKLISGDCYIFTDQFRAYGEETFFMCDKFVACNKHMEEEFILR